MPAPKGFKPADLGGEPSEVDCTPGYRRVEINWSKPRKWSRDEYAPIGRAQKKPGYLYIISWDHHRAANSDTIAYIGITSSLDHRFDNHPKAASLLKRRRSTYLSIGHIDFGRWTKPSANTRWITEELEHILIWAMWETLENERKLFCVPGQGTNGGGAWHIINAGYRFSGRLPREIVYPWMIVKPGRNRSNKPF